MIGRTKKILFSWIAASALVFANLFFLTGGVQAAGEIYWPCDPRLPGTETNCLITAATNIEEMQNFTCPSTSVEKVIRGNTYQKDVQIINQSSQEVEFVCLNCGQQGKINSKITAKSITVATFEWQTNDQSDTLANFHIQINSAAGEQLYGNLCIQVETGSPTSDILSILPSMSCSIDADCKDPIFQCNTSGQGGICTQNSTCNNDAQCEALYGGGALCNLDQGGRCEIYNNQDSNQSQTNQNSGSGTVGGCREGQDCVSLTNPLSSTNIPKIIGSAVQVVVGIIGTIAFVVFVYGGFQWLTSAGNSEKIAKGLQAMLWAGIGIIVVFSSYAILTLILQTLQATP